MNSVGWQNLKHVTVIPVPPLAKAIEQSTEDGPLPYSNYIIMQQNCDIVYIVAYAMIRKTTI
jgi:hypothetical protein